MREARAEVTTSAQGRDRRDRGRNNGGLLDDVGLGSLADIPWDAFGIGVVVSALIGAGGGFIYAGIVDPKED